MTIKLIVTVIVFILLGLDSDQLIYAGKKE